MAGLQALIRAVDELSADELKHLFNHIVETRMQFIPAPEENPPAPRILGLFEHVGKTWMSDDFDAELPSSFWLGQE